MKCRTFSIFCLTPLVLAACATIQTTKDNNIDSTPKQQTSSSPSAKISEDKVREQLIDALLEKRLRIDVIHESTGNVGCAPLEPYYQLHVSRRIGERYLADPDAPDGGQVDVRYKWEDTDLGHGITLIERTGEVSVMDVCLE